MNIYKYRYFFYVMSLLLIPVGLVISLLIYGYSFGDLYPQQYYFIIINHNFNKVMLTVAIIAITPLAIVEHLIFRRMRLIDDDLPFFLSTLSESLKSGLDFIDAWELASVGKGPVREAARKALRKIYLGVDFMTAMDIFSDELGTKSAERVAAIIKAAYLSGGKPVETLSIAARAYQDLDRFRRDRLNRLSSFTYISYISLSIFLIAGYILITLFFPATSQLPALGIEITVPPVFYEGALFYASLIIGVSSTIVSSKLATGTVRASIKHLLITFIIIYFVFFYVLEQGIMVVKI